MGLEQTARTARPMPALSIMVSDASGDHRGSGSPPTDRTPCALSALTRSGVSIAASDLAKAIGT